MLLAGRWNRRSTSVGDVSVDRFASWPSCLAGASAALCLGAASSYLLAPTPAVLSTLAAPDGRAAAARVVAGHWFGEAVKRRQAAPSVSVSGVYAPQGASPGFAIVGEAGREQPLLVGDSRDGWTLKRVTGQGVVMVSGDGERFLPLTVPAAAVSGVEAMAGDDAGSAEDTGAPPEFQRIPGAHAAPALGRADAAHPSPPPRDVTGSMSSDLPQPLPILPVPGAP